MTATRSYRDRARRWATDGSFRRPASGSSPAGPPSPALGPSSQPLGPTGLLLMKARSPAVCCPARLLPFRAWARARTRTQSQSAQPWSPARISPPRPDRETGHADDAIDGVVLIPGVVGTERVDADAQRRRRVGRFEVIQGDGGDQRLTIEELHCPRGRDPTVGAHIGARREAGQHDGEPQRHGLADVARVADPGRGAAGPDVRAEGGVVGVRLGDDVGRLGGGQLSAVTVVAGGHHMCPGGKRQTADGPPILHRYRGKQPAAFAEGDRTARRRRGICHLPRAHFDPEPSREGGGDPPVGEIDEDRRPISSSGHRQGADQQRSDDHAKTTPCAQLPATTARSPDRHTRPGT